MLARVALNRIRTRAATFRSLLALASIPLILFSACVDDAESPAESAQQQQDVGSAEADTPDPPPRPTPDSDAGNGTQANSGTRTGGNGPEEGRRVALETQRETAQQSGGTPAQDIRLVYLPLGLSDPVTPTDGLLGPVYVERYAGRDAREVITVADDFLGRFSRLSPGSSLNPDARVAELVSRLVAEAADAAARPESWRFGQPVFPDPGVVRIPVRMFRPGTWLDADLYLERRSTQWYIADIQADLSELADARAWTYRYEPESASGGVGF